MSMQALVVEKPGGPETLKLNNNYPKPKPTDGRVLIRIKAFGMNRAELHARAGFAGNAIQFPRVIGIECVGVVEASPGCARVKPGDTVCAMMTGMGRAYDGSYAEYTSVPEAACYVLAKPADMSWKQFAAIPEMFQTTNGSLTAALECKQGHRLLVRGGTSSIGLCAIALAKEKGLTVIATSRSQAKTQLLKECGADHVIVDTGSVHEEVRALYPDGIDRCIDLVGTPTLRDDMLSCRPGGVVCMTGCLAGWDMPAIPDLWHFIPSTVKLTVYGGGAGDVTQDELQEFVNKVGYGSISVPVETRDFMLKDVPTAHELMETNQCKGKVVCVLDKH